VCKKHYGGGKRLIIKLMQKHPFCLTLNNNMKKLTLLIAVFTSAFLLIGCNVQKDELEAIHKNNENFINTFMVLKGNAFIEDITPSTTKAVIHSADTKALKLCMPEDCTSLSIPEIKSVRNLNDLQLIANKYAASFKITNVSEPIEDVILISESKISASMAAMIKQSKQYLNSLGMSDCDIQQMLEDENADESILVPFVLSLIEHDNNCYYAWQKNNKLSLIPHAYAMEWGQVGHCALNAIGADIFFGLGNSMAKAWTKAAMKKAFKAAAERVIGPVGVAIAIIDFAICMG